MKRRALQIAEQGRPHGGSNRPFGYEEDRITIRESEATIIRQLVFRFLAGESFRSLCSWLDAEGVRTVRGGGWRTTSLKQMLTSARIAGLREHKGDIVADAVWEPIITPEQRLQILGKLASRQASGRRTPRRYVLSGMLKCGKCGNTLYSARRAAAMSACPGRTTAAVGA
ncbi:recombinase family protein [Prescottella equi]|uniref:recombinase family protein n=1 Tax=Rhodococcus hoagii TaxID=43767 RepID=UPI0039BE28F6